MDIGLVKFANHKTHNTHMHSDSKKCRSFLALLFTAGDVKRYHRLVSSMSPQCKAFRKC